jgi:hypothetical protein
VCPSEGETPTGAQVRLDPLLVPLRKEPLVPQVEHALAEAVGELVVQGLLLIDARVPRRSPDRRLDHQPPSRLTSTVRAVPDDKPRLAAGPQPGSRGETRVCDEQPTHERTVLDAVGLYTFPARCIGDRG